MSDRLSEQASKQLTIQVVHCLEDHISSLISSQQILPSRQELNHQEHAACHKIH